jgi:RNA-binding protein
LGKAAIHTIIPRMHLTERQKKFLRREAHNLNPVVTLGDKGITPALIKELNTALEHHELIKVKVRAGDRDSRDQAVAELTTKTDAILISRVGNIAAMYRPRKKDPKIVLPKAG